MNALFITADDIDAPSGGGLVCRQEIQALREEFGEVEVWDRNTLAGGGDPWGWDEIALERTRTLFTYGPLLVHGYSGSFPKTTAMLKDKGHTVTWTVAAHDRHISRREHEQLGLAFPYPHLTEEHLWQQYIEGYRLTDVIICPSTAAARTVRDYGPAFASKDIRVVPHGCTIKCCPYCRGGGTVATGPNDINDWDNCPQCAGNGHQPIVSLPRRFTVGYMGSFGADKGVRYLLEAWKQLDYRDATLVLAGRDSTSSWAEHLIRHYGGGNIECRGWVDDVSDFYNSINLYVQPSATEGFGIEVVEAMAHGRSVVCSVGAGAVDLLGLGQFHSYVCGMYCDFCDSKYMASEIDVYYRDRERLIEDGGEARHQAEKYTWDKIREQYRSVWRSPI